MKTNKIFLYFVLSVLLSLFASCSPKKMAVSQKTSLATAYIAKPVGQQNCPSSALGYSSVSKGAVYDSSNNWVQFETNVKGFFSTTIDPKEIGQISSDPSYGGGVSFEGAIKLDSSGQVVSGQSSLIFTAIDYYALMGIYPSVTARFASSTGANFEGQFTKNSNQGVLIIRDAYGTVRFDGQLDAQYFSGTITFENTSHILNGETPARGTLGQFRVARCGFLQ